MTTALATELLPDVAELLTENPVPGLIGGDDVLAAMGRVYDPRSGLGPAAGRGDGHAGRRRGSGGPGGPTGIRHERLAAVRPTSAACSCTGWPTPSNATRKSWFKSRPWTPAKSPPRPSGKCRTSPTRCATTPIWLCTCSPQPAGHLGQRGVGLASAVGAVRVHLPLELPRAPDGLEPLAGAGGRQHGDRQAARGRAAGGHLSGPAGPRGRHSRRGDQRRAGPWRSGRRGAGGASRHPADVVYRLARDRPADRRGLRTKPRAGEVGAWRQGRGRGVRRR